MFGVMRPQNPTIDPALQRLFDVSFDDALRESVIGYLRREGMSRTRFGRTVLGDPRFGRSDTSRCVSHRSWTGCARAPRRT